jgi:integrase
MSRKPKLGSIYQRGSVYWVKYYRAGRAVRESSKSEKFEDAERLLKRRQGEVVTGKFAGLGPERIRFAELAEEVINDYRINDLSSLDHVRRRLRLHLLPTLGQVRAAELGTGAIKRYIAQRRREEASNATINRELAIVKRAFRIAARAEPPMVARVPHIPMLEEHNVRKGFVEHDVYLRLRDELPEDLRPLFVVAYYTGARVGELKALQWGQVDLAASRITLEPGTTKNREGRSLPIYGEMSDWLRKLKAERDRSRPNCPFVFQREGSPIKNFRKSWAGACERAEVSGKLFHDLRRTAVRNMVRAGIPEKVAMQISGHKTRSVFDRYNIVCDRDLTAAAERMEQHMARMGTITGTVRENQGKTAADELSQIVYYDGAGGGGRTHMTSEGRGILSPVRLPVPPLQRELIRG